MLRRLGVMFLVVSLHFQYYTVVAMPSNYTADSATDAITTEDTSDEPDGDVLNSLRPNADEVGPHMEGDIVHPSSFERHIRAVTNQDYRKWLGATVPYTIDKYYNSAQRQIIYAAIDEIQSKTCVNFVEWNSEQDYIRIMPGEGCSSYVGRRGGEQVVTLDPWRCLGEVGVVAHELLHVLGFYHEHTRLDRDSYIDVLWSNMEGGREVNFQKRSPGTIDTLGKSYDYNSVMHYSAYAFSLDDRRPTLMPRYPTVTLKSLGQRRALSQLDVEKVNGYYGCDDRGRTRTEQEPAQPEYVYSKAIRTTPQPTTTTSRTYLRPKSKYAPKKPFDNPCENSFRTSAMLSTADDNMIIMNRKHFWIVDPHRYLSKPLLISDYYTDLPTDIDAAFTWINGHTYFFKGASYWKYQGYQPLEGYPQDIKNGFPGLPDNLDAVFLWTDGKILFIKGSTYYLLHPTHFDQVRGPFSLRADLGFPSKIQAGLEWPAGIADPDETTTVWILADNVLYPVDSSSLKIAPGKSPKRLMDWLRCDLYSTTTSD